MNMQVRQAWWRDLSVPAVVAGFITVLVGFASSAVIVFRPHRLSVPTGHRSPHGCGHWDWAWVSPASGCRCAIACRW